MHGLQPLSGVLLDELELGIEEPGRQLDIRWAQSFPGSLNQEVGGCR
jgi:hypothetical protein